MKVNQNPSPSTTSIDKALSPAKKDSVTKGGMQEALSSTPRNGAQVEISDAARLMKQASDIARNAPDVRADKVADLKKRISEGTYQVDSASIADRLVEEHLLTDFGKNSL